MPSQPLPLRMNDLRRRLARRLTRVLLGAPVQLHDVPLPRAGVYRILICHMSLTLGNALLLTPLMQELEATWPGAEIDVITRSRIARVLFGHYGGFNRAFQLPARGVGHPLQLWRTLRDMRKLHYDLAIDPDPQSQTGRLLLRLARARFKLGFNGPKKSGHVTHAAAVPDDLRSTGQRPVYLLRHALGRVTPEQAAAGDYPVPDIRLDAAELAWGRRTLQRMLDQPQASTGGRSKVIGIFANATGPKWLDAAWWDTLLQALEAALPDARLVEIVPHFGRSLLDSRYPAYYTGDLRKLASVLGSLDAHVSLDCGVMHLACAAGAPTLGIFTTTHADEWGPYGPHNHVLRAHDLPPATIARELATLIGALPARRLPPV